MKALSKMAMVFLVVPAVVAVFLFGSAEGSPPYPPSTMISGITFDASSLLRLAPGSDNWASTWAQDGNMYATWGDGGGMGGTNSDGRVSLGVARIIGPPESFTAQNVWGGKNGENPATFDGKSVGMLSVDGVLYMWRGTGSGWTAWEETWLAKSVDMGVTWELSSSSFFRYTDGFSKPTFLNFGQDYAGARDAYVYVYAPDASGGESLPQTRVSMGRVPKDQIDNRAAYEFFKGLDRDGNPMWTSDVSQRQAVFVDTNGKVTDSPSVIYNPGLNRYLMCKTHDLNPSSGASGGLGVFDAPDPWGPWTTVEYVDDWMGSDNMYFCQFPTNWISSDGLMLWMVFTGYGSDLIAKDAYQHMKGVVTLMSDSTSPNAPSGLSATTISDSRIDLTWSPASDPESGVASYKIYRDGVFVVSLSGTTYMDNGLSEGTNYLYEISAVNGVGLEGAKSPSVSKSTVADTTAPTIVSVSVPSVSRIVVVFSEALEESSASNAGNYSVNNGIVISSGSLAGDLKTVTLTVSPQTDGGRYQLLVNNVRDRASTPNVIASNSTVDYTFLAGLVINNLSVSNAKLYEVVQNGFNNGVLVYIDRSYIFSAVPNGFSGGTYVKTSNDDKGSIGSNFLSFDVNQDVAVYIAHDERLSLKPAWMGDFGNTGLTVIIADKPHSLWRKDYGAGSVTLGGNELSSGNMYSVVIYKLGNAPTLDRTSPEAPTGLSVDQEQ